MWRCSQREPGSGVGGGSGAVQHAQKPNGGSWWWWGGDDDDSKPAGEPVAGPSGAESMLGGGIIVMGLLKQLLCV